MLDMGPYYLTALVNMIGGVRKVAGMCRATFPTRTITSEPKKGKVVEVETPTHIVGLLQFDNGAIGQITTSFDVWFSKHGCSEVYGTEGSLIVPDPNGFGGEIKVRSKGESEWREVPATHKFDQNNRGLGVLDMAYGIAKGRAHRASGDLAFHVLEIMHGIVDASDSGRTLELSSSVSKPEPMPVTSGEDDLPE